MEICPRVKLDKLLRIAAQPYILVAEIANSTHVANGAKNFEANAIAQQMPERDVRSNFN